jgi:hypothetical protein
MTLCIASCTVEPGGPASAPRVVLKPGTLDDTSWVKPSHIVFMNRQPTR